MVLTQELFAFLCAIVVFHCKADHHLPAPRELSYRWVDPFTVNISWSWEKPDNLPNGCEINYKLHLVDRKTHEGGERKPIRTKWKYFALRYLTEEMGSGHWEFRVQALGVQSCDGWNKSNNESITLNTTKPQADVVKDFKCFLGSSETKCSWIPVNPSLDLTLAYRFCGNSEEDIKSLQKCDQPYSSGERKGCHLKIDAHKRDICVHVKTAAGFNTFKPKLVIHVPKLSIEEDGDILKLLWTPPDGENRCGWEYKVCYKECNKQRPCKSFKPNKEITEPLQIPFDKNCLYEFEYNVTSDLYCIPVFSDGSAVVTHGSNKLPDRTLTVIAIVIVSIFLSACVILSCYCFRRHSAIICPIIPDPSAIFKEMMMSGNKELKTTTGSLYTPVPEPVEPCKITLVTENSILQQNS